MEKNIQFRAVIEVLGKPEEHVDTALKGYIEKLTNDEKFDVLNSEFAEIKKQDEQELWAGFAEVDVAAAKIEDLTTFCFEYMPSLLEIMSPKQMNLTDDDLSKVLTDLQAKLHTVDMVAKQVRMENDQLKHSLNALLQNYTLLLLSKQGLTSSQLSTLTGVHEERLADFLDSLIDAGKIDLKGETYSLVKKEVHDGATQTG